MKKSPSIGILLATASLLGLTACSSSETRSTAMTEAGSTSTTALAPASTDTKYNDADEVSGTISKFLLTPRGEVDGFIVNDGTQVSFPPHMSAQLTRTVAVNDSVLVKGFFENEHVFKAEKITNTSTSKSVAEMVSPPPSARRDQLAGALPPPGVKPAISKREVMRQRKGLKQISAEGTVQNHLYGPAGDLNGVVLSDGSVVRFAPELDQARVNTEVGDSIKATGYGTRNSWGQSIEATEVLNQ